jgi:hypothetical protein
MDEDEAEEEESEEPRRVSMDVTIPLDAHGCVRRDCPRCGLDFKQAIAEADLSGILAASVSRLKAAQGGQAESSPTSRCWCPYCGHEDDSQSFMHEEHVTYLRRLLYREFFEPLVRDLFSPFEELRSSRHMKVTVTRGPRSARPMLGPEPTDMARVRCLTCDELFKVMPEWRGNVCCPGCGLQLVGM